MLPGALQATPVFPDLTLALFPPKNRRILENL